MMEESSFPPADIASLFAGTNDRKLWKKLWKKALCFVFQPSGKK